MRTDSRGLEVPPERVHLGLDLGEGLAVALLVLRREAGQLGLGALALRTRGGGGEARQQHEKHQLHFGTFSASLLGRRVFLLARARDMVGSRVLWGCFGGEKRFFG